MQHPMAAYFLTRLAGPFLTVRDQLFVGYQISGGLSHGFRGKGFGGKTLQLSNSLCVGRRMFITCSSWASTGLG